MELKNDKVILRQTKSADIDDYKRWSTTDTEWQLWDAPWETEDDASEFVEWRKSLVSNPTDTTLEIDTVDGKHIGWVNTYFIDDEKTMLGVGLDIPEVSNRGCGYGFAALTLFLDHLFKTHEHLYTQTWSGNVRMVALADKMGWQLIDKKVGIREVRGGTYDALTWKMSKSHSAGKR